MSRYFNRLREKVKSSKVKTPEQPEPDPPEPNLPLPGSDSVYNSAAESPLDDENNLIFLQMHRRDLWREAFLNLSGRERALLSGIEQGGETSPDIIPLIKSILGAANILKQEEEGKIWKMKLNRLVDGTTKVKALIDAGLSFDPTKYGALAWAVISFGMQMSINAKEIREFTFDSSDYIANIIARYRIYESQYRNIHPSDTTDALKQFEEGTITVYTCVLQFVGQMKQYLERSSLEHGAASILPTNERSLSKTKESIGSKDLEIQTWLPILEHECIQENFQKVSEKLNSLARPNYENTRYRKKVESFLFDQEREAVLRWLPNNNMHRIHAQTRSKAEIDFDQKYQPGSWLLKHIDLQLWVDAQFSCGLWLHGEMGTGKTILTSTVIEHLAERYAGSSNGALAYVYCSGADSRRSNPLDILMEILRQLASTEAGLAVFREWKEGRQPSELTQLAVLQLILKMINLNIGRQTTIVIDALDEIDRDGLASVTGALHLLLEKSEGLLKVFVSSRPESRIRDQVGTWTKIYVDPASTRADIETYIELEVDRLLEHKARVAYLKPTIKAILTERANGMFRYVEMSTQWICGGESPIEIRQAIAELPSELSGIYHGLFERIESRRAVHQDYACLAISWILGMKVSLSLNEVLKAIIVGTGLEDEEILETNLDDILTACEGLVIYNKKRDVLEFGHISVLEFIQREKQDMYSWSQVHLRIGSACVNILSDIHQVYHERGPYNDVCKRRTESIGHWTCPSCSDINEEPPDRQASATLVQYANMMWAYHCSLSSSHIRVGPSFTTFSFYDMPDEEGSIYHYIRDQRLRLMPYRDSLLDQLLLWVLQFAYIDRLEKVTLAVPSDMESKTEGRIEVSPSGAWIQVVDKLVKKSIREEAQRIS